ncbi:MAG TPA: hypothetical protein VMT32_02455 [Bryobacteraceae bacterium]|nr:hypothetical protein [Bryobacteraceae bacterium]
MTANPLGKVTVATPGTLVPLSTDPTLRASKIYFQVIPGLTGKGYIGKSGMVRATLVKVIRVLWPNSAGGISDSFFLESQDDADVLNLSEYYIDMDVAGEGLLVTYWTE